MNTYLKLFFVGFILLGFAGCGFLQSKGEKAAREMIAATIDLRDALRQVKDASTAREVTGSLGAKYTRFEEALKNTVKYKDSKMLKTTADQLNKEGKIVGDELKVEIERVKNLKGLPVEFWKVMKMRTADLANTIAEVVQTANLGMTDPDALSALTRIKEQYAKFGYEGIVSVELDNVPVHRVDKVLAEIQKKNSGLNIIHQYEDNKLSLSAAPVKDYKAFLATFELGTIYYEDEAQRAIHITVDVQKIEEQIAEEQRARQRKIDEENEQFRKKSEAESARHMKEFAEVVKKEEGPDRNDPKYFEIMADHLVSGDHWKKDKAIEVLLVATPADVPSEETRKKIARGFKKLAENNSPFDKEKAVKGLVIWGGKYSTPILMKMLGDRHGSADKEIIDALGELKDPQAAEVLAGKLGDFFVHESAYNALKEMGEGAEDALIAVGPSNDPKVCVSAITLLGDSGTEKSLPFLRDAQTSRNPDVRNASKTAIKKIIARKNKAKTSKS